MSSTVFDSILYRDSFGTPEMRYSLRCENARL